MRNGIRFVIYDETKTKLEVINKLNFKKKLIQKFY